MNNEQIRKEIVYEVMKEINGTYSYLFDYETRKTIRHIVNSKITKVLNELKWTWKYPWL